MANQYYWMLFIIAIGVAIISNLLRKIIKLLEKQNESFLDIITYLKTNKNDINENGKVKNYDGNNTKSIKYEPWICKNCGTKNPILNEICTKCGAKKDNTSNPNQEDLYGSNDDVKNENKNFIKYNKIPSDVFDKIIDYCPDRGTILKLKNNYRKEDDVYIINNEIDEQNLIFIKNYMTKNLESFNSKK